MKAFMKEENKTRGTMEFPGIERYKDEQGEPIKFLIRRLGPDEIKEIRELYTTEEVYRDPQNDDRPVITGDGQVATIKKYDSNRAGLHMMVEAFVQPKLDDKSLMEYYGELDKLNMPYRLFRENDEFRYANQCLLEACGLSKKGKNKDKETVEKLKN